MTVYFLYGDEDFNIDLELEKMRSKLNPDFLSMSYHVMNNPAYSDLIQALRTPPMMFGCMLTVIDLYKYFFKVDNKELKFEDSELDDIKDALENNQEGADIVFVVKLPRGENKKLDSRRKLYKILSKYNSKEFPVFKTYKTSEIISWIKTRAKLKGISFEDDAVKLLIEHVGNNLREFDGEIDKLKLIAYPKKTITKEMVENICISNQDLFNLTDLIMKNEKDKALLEFRKLLDKKYPLEILSTIQTMLRKWILLKTNAGKLSQSELAKVSGIQDFLVNETLQKLKNTPTSNLVRLKEHLFNAEYKIKNGESADIISEVEYAIIR